MQNKDIHNHLDQKEIRDYLARQYHRTLWISSGEKAEDLEEQIARLQERLEAARQFRAIREIMRLQGWSAMDISNEIPYDKKTYFDFIGTEEECGQLSDLIEEENNKKEVITE